MKKKLLFVALAVGFTVYASAQISASSIKSVTDKAKTAVSTSGVDASALTSGLMSKLTPALSLSKIQVPKVKDLVSNYITQKMSIQSLMKTDKAKYLSKLGNLSGVLNSGLKSTLSTDQFTKFLSLKPKTNDTSNPISQLFY